MRRALVLLVPALLFLLAFPVSSGRYNDDFDDGEDIVDFDDNDFAEFEDMNDDLQGEPETAPAPRVSLSQPEEDEDEDEDEATVELEDGQDGFEDAETQVEKTKYDIFVFSCWNVAFGHICDVYESRVTWNVSPGSRHGQQI